jgi:hypothetical protein
MAAFRDITDKESGLYETCARHTARQTSRLLQSAYYCDECAQRLTGECFNRRAPVYHGDTLKGFCGLCNCLKDVTLRQWFVCGPCWNVVLAYQKSMAATAHLHSWWKDNIAPNMQHLSLIESEPVRLAPYARVGPNKREKAQTLENLDFIVADNALKPAKSIFHIEQKTGPGSIDEIKEFQLDVNDINDIVGAMKHTKIPSYVIHVQAVQEYSLPTKESVVRAMWWTDPYKIKANLKRVGSRADENKKAIFFKPAAFAPISTFLDELKNKGYEKLAAEMNKNPIDFW